jgi:two-component system C4-dicarboxylate transport sensor histidine kinase DctB
LVLPTAEHGVTVSTALEGDGHVACVPEEFNQVLTNLIENAFDAVPTDGSGTVEIRGASDDSSIVLSVKDNGVGIAPDELPKIFTAFYTTKDVGRGLGMGLTIARRVVSALGGTINVASHVGSGTEVVVKVPRELSAARPRAIAEDSLLEAAS